MPNTTVLRDSWRSWVANDFHPAGPRWLQWLWTLLFCAALAVGFTVVAIAFNARGDGVSRGPAVWGRWYLMNLHMCLVIGVLIHLMFDGAHRLLGEARVVALGFWGRMVFYSGIPLVGVAIGWPLGFVLLGRSVDRWFSGERVNMLVGSLLIAMVISLVLFQIFEAKARQIEAERRAAESRLHLLQAQIEPHFLFNTLANVLSLIDRDPPRARGMLEAFTDYLRSSFGTMRAGDVTLDGELALASAYLQVQQMRMDDRLRVVIEATDEARRASLPPLLVQPLVENAIQHGLEPKLDGGTVTLRAWRDGDRLNIDVADDGVGLASTPAAAGHGLALANLRERLAARYGSAARLTLEPLATGTRCRLELPCPPST